MSDEIDDGPFMSSEFRRIAIQQDSLRGDVAVVAGYAESIDADEWAGIWFDSDRDPVVIAVAVTGRAEHHAAELRARMANPGRLVVVEHERSELALRQLHDEVWGLRGEYPIASVGTDLVANVVSIGLSVNDSSLRDELQRRFGAQVRVERGTSSARAL